MPLNAGSPVWSPDGAKLAFASLNELYTMNIDGSGAATRLTNNIYYDFTPDWQPLPGTPTSLLQFSAAQYNVGEGDRQATITVTRTGALDSAVNVRYQTNDNPAAVPCSPDLTAERGIAYARCDYATTIDTLSFAANEASKTFTIPIIDDVHVEGNETVNIALFGVSTGAGLGTQTTATLTITDNDTVAGQPNPIYTTPFFVRQQYLDFLSREPEAGEPWSNVLNNCSDVNNNPNCDRLTVSAAFFGSPEFQLKGFYVFRFYRLVFKSLPQYSDIVADMRAVTGQTEQEVYQKKAAFADAYTQRPFFISTFGGQSNEQYVATLMGHYSLTSITTPDPATPDGTQKVTLTSTDLVNRLNAATLTRAQVLRAIADSDQVGTAEFTRAFVAMQYYGYLRRTPEDSGYNAWLNYLNAHPGDFRTMVNGFMNSGEYRLRFGRP